MPLFAVPLVLVALHARVEALPAPPGHAWAIFAAASRDVSPEFLVGLAYAESDFDPRSTSRWERGRRRTGVPRWSSPPRGVRGPYFCGVLQAQAGKSWDRCLALRDLAAGYKAGADEIRSWLKICRRLGSPGIRCALTGHVAGFDADKKVTCSARCEKYIDKVLRRARKARRRAARPAW